MNDQKEMNDMEVDCAVDALMRAEEIKQDPELMKKVLERVSVKKKAISSIEQLRKVAMDKINGEDSEDESEDSSEEAPMPKGKKASPKDNLKA